MAQSEKNRFRFLFRALPIEQPAPMAGFVLPINQSSQTVPKKFISYRPPKIVKGKRWYIAYSYRVPVQLRDRYPREWERFRVFEDINRYKTDEYAETLKYMVEYALEHLGYNPFEGELAEVTAPVLKPSEWSLSNALDKFEVYCKEKGLRKKTLQTYGTVINLLREYFYKDNQVFKPVTSITKNHVKAFLSHYNSVEKWNANTYNGYLGHLNIFFNWLVKEDHLAKSPATGIETKVVSITRHRYYTDAIAEKLKAEIKRVNPYLYSFVEFVYYTAIRPKSEARFIQIKHLLFDRDLIHIPGHIAKNKTGDYIPMTEELKANLIHLKEMNPELYVWGTHGPAEKPTGQNHFANMYKPFKDKFGLGAETSIYAWKHTRCIHLAQQGADPYDIMRLFRHSSLEQTMKYMRDLGLTDFSAVLKKGKKF